MIPPAAEDYQVALREKAQRRERVSGRDFTRYNIVTSAKGEQKGLKKRWFMYELIREAVHQGVSPVQIIEAVPIRKGSMFLQVPGKLTPREVLERFPAKSDRRYFSADDEAFHVGNTTYVLTNQWGSSTEAVAKAVTALLPAGKLQWSPAT